MRLITAVDGGRPCSAVQSVMAWSTAGSIAAERWENSAARSAGTIASSREVLRRGPGSVSSHARPVRRLTASARSRLYRSENATADRYSARESMVRHRPSVDPCTRLAMVTWVCNCGSPARESQWSKAVATGPRVVTCCTPLVPILVRRASTSIMPSTAVMASRWASYSWTDVPWSATAHSTDTDFRHGEGQVETGDRVPGGHLPFLVLDPLDVRSPDLRRHRRRQLRDAPVDAFLPGPVRPRRTPGQLLTGDRVLTSREQPPHLQLCRRYLDVQIGAVVQAGHSGAQPLSRRIAVRGVVAGQR